MEYRYKGLRLIGWLAQVMAWVVLILSVLAALGLLFSMRDVWPGLRYAGRNWTGVLLLPIGVYFFLQLYVIGAVLMLLTDLELNTRRSTSLSEQLLKQHRDMASAMQKASRPATVEMTPPPPPPPAPSPSASTSASPPSTSPPPVEPPAA